MNTDSTGREVRIPATEWEALAELSRREGVPPADLVREAVRRYLDKKNELLKARRALSKSFGVWKDREDLQRDSLDLVNELREDWNERARRLGLD
ncbi:MAG: ribbon-helix-helix protein, CopG family [Chloroflexota bacterium]|nr:ribbon-helix-helix protein, CopG family [Chloroflexota bacterium]